MDTLIGQKYEDTHFVDSTKPVWNYSLFAEEDIRNFQSGTHYRLYHLFGSHRVTVLGAEGYYFAVWAPNATAVSVIGNFNNWTPDTHPLFVRLDRSGIWEGFIPHIPTGEAYKYHIHGYKGGTLDKGDPYAYFWEMRPMTASITWELDYPWQDTEWMTSRKAANSLEAPWTIYEVHLASWMRPDKNDEERYNSYDQIRELLVPYVKKMGFTHVELMPIMEHPFDGSWGYQGTGYYAPTSRFGDPQGFMALVEAFHREGIGVLLDWVPSHFPYDYHGLYLFDGANTYEYADMRKGFHPDWNSYIFNYKRGEVKSFLISNARYWLDKYRDFPDVQTIAEEATDWPGVSRPTFAGGLGFGMKWMMGWMHDTLDFFKLDPIYRKDHQDKFTFSMMYYYDENFVLPLSHDEVVHGKSPMIYKMPGDDWQKFANLRLLYTYMMTHPGGKLLFMGDEFGATTEWNYKTELPWGLLQYDAHRLLKDCVKDLNFLLRNEPALFENQFNQHGFEWVDLTHRNESVVVYRRKGKDPAADVLVILNFTPVVRRDWKVYARGKAAWREIFNSDDKQYWGTGDTNNPAVPVRLVDETDEVYELTVHLPPLGGVVLR